MSVPPASSDTVSIYSPERLQRLVGYLWNIRHIPQAGSTLFYVALGAFAGLRPAEAVDLDWKDVDFERRLLRLPSGPGRAERLVPIQENLHGLLLPFQNRRGRVIIHKKVAALLREYCAEASVPHIPNGLRRSYAAYRLVETPVETVQAELGMDAAMLKEKFTHLPTVAVAHQYWAICP